MAKRKTTRPRNLKFDGDDLKQVAVFAIAVIFTLEAIALWKGIDGTIFGLALAGIGAIMGYLLKAYISHGK